MMEKYTIKLVVDPADDMILSIEQIGCPWKNPNMAKEHLINVFHNYIGMMEK